MKKIGIDARLYAETGVGVYIRNLLHYLHLHSTDEYQWFIYALEDDANVISSMNPTFTVRTVQAKWHTVDEQLSFYRDIEKDSLSLMHFTYFSYPVRYIKPFIATVHDLTPLLFPTGKASTLPFPIYQVKLAVLRYVLSQQVKNAQALIVPSKTVANQLISYFGKTIHDKIKVQHEGLNYEFEFANEKLTAIKQLPSRYILSVGNAYPHKNIVRLIEAYIISGISAELVIAGPNNHFSSYLRDHISNTTASRIHFVHPENVNELKYLYSHALAFVNPSLSEGFGLPMLEAASLNIPIIASDIPVFHELLGNSFTFFDPGSTSDISRVLRSVDSNIPKPQTSRTFSFEQMVMQYLELIRALLP